MMVLFVQFTEALHHHTTLADHHQPNGMINKAQLNADCAICHFLSHQQLAEDLQNQVLTFALAATVFSLLILLLIKIHVGHRYEITGRGPPASATLFL